VPKIFQDFKMDSYFNYETNSLESKTLNSEIFVDDEKWASLFEYTKENRINLNVRQVF